MKLQRMKARTTLMTPVCLAAALLAQGLSPAVKQGWGAETPASGPATQASAPSDDADWPFEVKKDSAGRPDGVAMLANDMWRAFGSDSDDARRGAVERFARMGETGASVAFMVMDRDERTRGKLARETLSRITHKLEGTDRQGMIAAHLSEHLSPRKGHPLRTRRLICELLGLVGDDASLQALYRAMSEPELQEDARRTIARIPGMRATIALISGLQVGEPPFKVGVLESLGQRGDTMAIERIAPLAISNPEKTVRRAALDALARIAHPGSLAVIREALEKDEPGAVDAMLDLGASAAAKNMTEIVEVAFNAVGRRDDLTPAQTCRRLELVPHTRATPQNVAGLIAAYTKAEARVRGCVLDALARIEGDAAAKAVVEALDPKRTRELVSAEGAKVNTTEFVGGMLGVLARREGAKPEQTAEVLATALGPAEAVEVLRRIVGHARDPETIRRAVAHLGALGVEVDPAQEAGFVTSWWTVGPFPNSNNAMWDQAYFPEEGVQLDAAKDVDGVTYAWTHHRTTQASGIVDLEKAVARKDDVGAYAYAEITVERAQDVLLKIGSDDGILVWVNGRQAHAHPVNRGLAVDQDVAAAKLQAGANRILVKILNAAHTWAFCLRVTTPQGEPIPFTQRGPRSQPK